MIDREKVIKGLEFCKASDGTHCPSCPYFDGECTSELCSDVLALLKEQDAVKPKKENDGVQEPWTTWWFVCGNCKEQLNLNDKYCRHCGRVVDWDG